MKVVIVEQYGMLWKMSRSKFVSLIRRASQGKEYNLDDFGKRIGEITHRMPWNWEMTRCANESMRGKVALNGRQIT